MAYVDFSSDPTLAAYAAAPRRDPTSPEETRLTALEWSVVALAQRDRIASLGRPSRLAVALGTVFGTRWHNPRLADPKLEALRRMAVLSWHRGFAVPVGELKAFIRAGFSASQYETLLASISTARSRLESRA